jgi:hypothetical protein
MTNLKVAEFMLSSVVTTGITGADRDRVEACVLKAPRLPFWKVARVGGHRRQSLVPWEFNLAALL